MILPAKLHHSTQKPLDGNRWLTHREDFEVTYRDKKHALVYFHFNQDKQKEKQPVLPPYCGFFSSFLDVVGRFVKDGETAVDIGAYDGDTTLPIAMAAGSGKVFAFEPGPSFSSQLTMNVKANAGLNIEAHPYAVMEEEGIHEFKYSAVDYNGGCGASNEWVGSYTVPRLVWAVNLEKFLGPKINLGDIRLIKTDTEGHDLLLLLGMKKLLREIRPALHIEWFPGTHWQLLELLNYLEYNMYCGFTLERLDLKKCEWRQDLVLLPSEKTGDFDLTPINANRKVTWSTSPLKREGPK